MIIQPIAGVDNSLNPTELRPIVVTADGHILVDVAGVIDVTIENVDQGDPNSIPNAWPVKITDGTNVLGTVLNPLVISDGGTSVAVTGSVSVTGSVDTELPAAAALSDNAVNPTTPLIGACLMGFDGTTWDRVRFGGVGTASLQTTLVGWW